MTSENQNYMEMALRESVFSIGLSRPNPAVGAVVVKDGIVVGKGRTQRPGSAHAEVMALRDAGEFARGAAIYVTLEPCCHYGRTPPCTKAIIDAGIAKVFYAHADPNPVVRGNSRKILEEAGIEVYEGVDACIAAEIEDGWDDDNCGGECHFLSRHPRADSACHPRDLSACHPREGGDLASSARHPRDLSASHPREGGDLASPSKTAVAEGRMVFHDIERYFEAYDYFVRNKRTFVEVKSAITDEGSMGYVLPDGSHKPMKITGEGANCWNHELRAISDAILVGAGTVLADNPSLNVRNAAGNDPVKIVWAGHHEFSAEEVARLKVFAPYNPETISTSHPRLDRGSSDFISEKKTLVFSCVPQPQCHSRDLQSQCHSRDSQPHCHSRESENLAFSSCEVVLLSGTSFAENWTLMIDDLSARGMHRLMVEPGAGLAKQLFAAVPADAIATSAQKPLWNRLDLWRSTDHTIEDALASFIDEGSVAKTLDFPAIPEKLIAKESFMVGPDVLTVFYPG